ncbi:MAG: hypothetical protein ACFFE2_02245 [Candidatus Thorarchaeota archaeon]
MSERKSIPKLDNELWTENAESVSKELREFAQEFGSFTPELFVQIKFHLLKGQGFTKQSRDELCELSIHGKTCPKCDLLYVAKKCLLWYRLFWTIRPIYIERAPPCIKLAFEKNSIKTVTSYLARINVFNPPFYIPKGGTSCNSMRRYGYCRPNEYCRAMTSDYILEYNSARERVKQSRKLG